MQHTDEQTQAVEPAYSYADLAELGEGSRWRIERAVRDGKYPKPDFYNGRHPRWLASTINEHRARLIQATRCRGNGTA